MRAKAQVRPGGKHRSRAGRSQLRWRHVPCLLSSRGRGRVVSCSGNANLPVNRLKLTTSQGQALPVLAHPGWSTFLPYQEATLDLKRNRRIGKWSWKPPDIEVRG